MYTIYKSLRKGGKRVTKVSNSLSLTLYPEKGAGAVVSTGELQNEASMEDISKLNPFSGMLMGISFNESLVAPAFWEENLFGCC